MDEIFERMQGSYSASTRLSRTVVDPWAPRAYTARIW